MTTDRENNFIANHDERLLDRELRQVLGGEGPSADAAARFREALGRETQQRAGEPGTAVPGGGRARATKPRRSPDTYPQRVRANWRLHRARSSWPVIVATAAALLVVVAVGVVVFNYSSQIRSNNVGQDIGSGTNVVIHLPANFNYAAFNEALLDTRNRAEQQPGPEQNSPRANQPTSNHQREVVDNPPANTNAPEPTSNRADNTPDAPQQPGPVVNAPDPTPPADNDNDNSAPPPVQPTQPGPPAVQRVVLAQVSGISRNARLKSRRNDSDDWTPMSINSEIEPGMTLNVSGIADLLVAGTALMRFDGEVTISGARDAISVTITKDAVYVDNVGTGPAITVGIAAEPDVHATIRDGALYCISARHQMTVHCLAGEGASTPQGVVGGSAVLKRDSLQGMRIDWIPYMAQLLRDLPPKLILHESFDAADARVVPVNTGEVRDGSGHGIHSRGYPVRLEVLPPARRSGAFEVLRMRVKFSHDTTLEAALWENGERGQKWQADMKAGEWRELEFAIEAGRQMDVLKIYAREDTRDDLAMEVDWIEVVHSPRAQ